MPLCPLCLHENPPDASVCQHCGRFRFGESATTLIADLESLTLSAEKMKEVSPRFGEPKAAVSITARLVVQRGLKVGAEYPLYDGANYLGRTGDRPADIDLNGLEPPDQVWSSRQHAVIHRDADMLSLEDLNSLNGTFLNRTRLQAGRKYVLRNDDVIQIGTLQFRVATA